MLSRDFSALTFLLFEKEEGVLTKGTNYDLIVKYKVIIFPFAYTTTQLN